MGKHLFQSYEHFEVYNCTCTTYRTTDGITPGSVIDKWRPSSSYGLQFNTIVDAVKRFVVEPFPQSPKDWRFEDGTVYVSMLSSTICGSYAGNDFAKKPTKTEMKKFEQGQQELYIVEFAVDVQKVTYADVDAEMTNAEGIGSGNAPVVSANTKKFTVYPSNYVKAAEEYINKGGFAPIGDDVVYKNIPLIAKEVAKKLDYWTREFGHDCYTVESAIEAFVMLSEGYEDWWARGCRGQEAEDRFVQALIEAMRSQGIELVDDRRG